MSQSALFPAPIAPGWQSDLLRDLASQWTPPPRVGVHLAILVEPYLGRIMDGTKTIESRWSMNRGVPFRTVWGGDAILFKRSGGPIVGFGVACFSQSITLRDRAHVSEVIEEAGAALGVGPDFFAAVADKKFVTLVQLEHVAPLDGSSIRCGKTGQAGWVVLRGRA